MDDKRRSEQKRRSGAGVRRLLSLAAGLPAPPEGSLPSRAELLAGILLVALLVGVPLTILPLILLPDAYVYLNDARLMYAIIVAVVILALLLNNRGRLRLATWVVILGSSVGMMTAAALRDPAGGRNLLFFLFVPLVVSSVLLPLSDVFAILLLNALGIVIFGLLPGRSFGFVVLGPLVFQLFSFGLVMLLYWYQHQEELAARERLKQEDIVYQSLLERAYDGVALLRNGRVAEATPGFAALFGQTVVDMVGREFSDFLAPQPGKPTAQMQATFAGEPIEVTVRAADDRERRLELVAQPVTRAGKPARLVAVRDVTERAEALRVAERVQQFAAGLREAPDRASMPAVITRLLLDIPGVRGAGLLTLDPEVGTWNVESLAGPALTAEQILNSVPAERAIPRETVWQTQPEISANLGLVPLQVEGAGVGLLAVLTSGAPGADVRRVLAEIGPMVARALRRAAAHEATRSYATVLEERVAERTREITAANLRLQELDRLKSKFVSDVSHELRTPVTSFKLYLDLLEQGSEQRRPAYIQVLRQQAERLQGLLDDILDLSRIELRRDTITLVAIDLARLLGGVVQDYADRAAAGDLVLRYRPAADLPPVLGQEQLLAQMAGNLLANAVNYTPRGTIDVLLDEDGDSLLLQVVDTGPGIPAGDVPHIFERFYRGTVVAQSNIPGSGLGLALVQDIVDIHGGSVAVETALGRGTTIAIRLPVFQMPQPDLEAEALADG